MCALLNAIRFSPKPTCILCESIGNKLYDNLQDRLFGASGTWNFKQCSNHDCGLIWLDPMPLPEDIGKAYEHYYTHNIANHTSTSQLKKYYHNALRSWLSKYYGYPKNFCDKSPTLIKWSYEVLTPFFRQTAPSVRFLPYIKNGRLLDIGCGSGLWLDQMKSLGWHVEGVDFDLNAVNAAKKLNIKVHIGSIEELNFPSGSFDAITLSHVIEHVPDPIRTISECYRLLKPGGRLVLFTPNASSICHQYFKMNWRGLEPPRHLHIFTFRSMRKLFLNTHFDCLQVLPHVGTSVTYQSYLLHRSRKPHIITHEPGIIIKFSLKILAVIGHLFSKYFPSLGEVLAVIAVKSSSSLADSNTNIAAVPCISKIDILAK